MNLFSKDKEIIFKILNAILLIWFITAVVVMITTIITIFVKNPSENYTYDEYKMAYCDYNLETTSETFKDNSCENAYTTYKMDNKSTNYYKLMTIYGAFANIIIVGGTIYFLNKETPKKEILKKKIRN